MSASSKSFFGITNEERELEHFASEVDGCIISLHDGAFFKTECGTSSTKFSVIVDYFSSEHNIPKCNCAIVIPHIGNKDIRFCLFHSELREQNARVIGADARVRVLIAMLFAFGKVLSKNEDLKEDLVADINEAIKERDTKPLEERKAVELMTWAMKLDSLSEESSADLEASSSVTSFSHGQFSTVSLAPYDVSYPPLSGSKMTDERLRKLCEAYDLLRLDFDDLEQENEQLRNTIQSIQENPTFRPLPPPKEMLEEKKWFDPVEYDNTETKKWFYRARSRPEGEIFWYLVLSESEKLDNKTPVELEVHGKMYTCSEIPEFYSLACQYLIPKGEDFYIFVPKDQEFPL